MNIYHYTKASTLPLILRHRTIRFTRADQLDDASEVPFSNDHLDARQFFVASWSLQPDELSGQWYRYGDEGRGVRISFSGTPFSWSRLSISIERSIPIEKSAHRLNPDPTERRTVGFKVHEVESPYDESTVFGNGYLLVPDTAEMRRDFGGPVSYVDDPVAEAAKLVDSSIGSTTVYGCGSNVARIKGKGWADQEEYRFVLLATEGPKLDYSASPSAYKEALLDMMQTRCLLSQGIAFPSVKHIDIPFATSACDEMTVTLGPKISEADRSAVVIALREFAPRAALKDSGLRFR